MPETDPLGTVLSLTAAQAEIRLAQQIAPESPIYNIAWYVEITGDLRRKAQSAHTDERNRLDESHSWNRHLLRQRLRHEM